MRLYHQLELRVEAHEDNSQIATGLFGTEVAYYGGRLPDVAHADEQDSYHAGHCRLSYTGRQPAANR